MLARVVMSSSWPSFDRLLPGRIKGYLSDHHRASSDELTEYLQRKFPSDYGRRKRNAFRKLVRQVHQELLEDGALLKSHDRSNHKDINTSKSKRRKKANEKSTESSSDSDNDEVLVDYTDTNSLNSSMQSMYKKKKRKSLSVPASPAPTYSYVDHSNFPSSEVSTEKMDQTTDVDFKAEINGANASDNFASDNLTLKTDAANNPSDTPEKILTSNVTVSDAFVSTELTKQLPHNRRRKKITKSQDQDIEVTGEKAKSKFTFDKTNVKFDDIGGNEKTLTELLRLLLHVKHPDCDRKLGVPSPTGVLLHGPQGCGKSLLADAIAGELDMPMLKVAAPEIISGVSGGSEEKIREIFELAAASAPCVIFFDEIDAITQKREHASKDMERRIVSQLLTSMDGLSKSPSQVLVVGATNCPDSIDPALRRDGRFATEICMGIPNEKDREDILRVLCKNFQLEKDFNFALLARLTPGYVGADLMSLCCKATMSVYDRILKTVAMHGLENNVEVKIQEDLTNQESMCLNGEKRDESDSKEDMPSDATLMHDFTYTDYLRWLRQHTLFLESHYKNVCIEFADFKNVLPNVQPSAKREGFATVPDVTWDDVGALESIREELTMAILAPVRNPRKFSALGLTKPRGILLAGPPGCGKTLLAKAIANESGINFISVKGPELLNMYVGESEKAVRRCFQRARDSSPCVIFFDELDSLCPMRIGAESGSTSRVVNQMLTEMDGLNVRGNVFVMAATNRPDIIDPAVLRPGRIEKTLYVGLPNADDRAKILQTLTKNGVKPPISSLVSLDAIARDERCSRFTGADLSSLVREAAENALREHLSIEHVIGQDDGMDDLDIRLSPEHFEKSWKKVKPSVSPKDELRYEGMRRNLEML